MFAKVLAIVTVATLVAAEDTANSLRNEFKKSLPKDCAKSYSVTCLKLDIVSWVDKLNEEDNYSVVPGISVVREKNDSAAENANTANMVADVAREFPGDPVARLDAFLLRKVKGYVDSHTVKLNNFWYGGDVAEARKKGGGGGGGGLLAIGALFAGTLGALALGGIAAIAGKALGAALMALVLSAVAGLKGHGGGGGKTTYEVVSQPIYSHENSHSASHSSSHAGGGHYRRRRDLDLNFNLPQHILQKRTY